jgi:hypothetical protein
MEQTQESSEYVALVNEARRALLDQSVTAITEGIKETVDVDDAAEVWQSIIDRLYTDYALKPRNPFLIAKYKVEISVHDESIEFETEYDGDEEELERNIYASLDIETSVTYTINLNMGNINESIEVTDDDGITVDTYDFLNNWVEVFITKI